MEYSSGRALDSEQIHEQLYDDSDLFSEFSQDSDLLVVLTLMPKYVRLI
jgi:hypothetical protein